MLPQRSPVQAHTRIVELLLHAGADPNARCAQGRTAAHHAAHAGNAGVIACLLGCPSTDWRARDLGGYTPQDLAREKGHMDVLELLLAVPG